MGMPHRHTPRLAIFLLLCILVVVQGHVVAGQHHLLRRLCSSVLVGVVSLDWHAQHILVPVLPARADDFSVAAEKIRKVSAILPGMGQPDVYYPSIYEGPWRCEQEITGISSPIEEGKSEQTTALELLSRYEARLSSGNGKLIYTRVFSPYDGKVVLDRGVSATNLYNALSKSNEKWLATFDPSNANSVGIASSDGLVFDTRVTKRSVEDIGGTVVNADRMVPVTVNRKDDALGFSEFTRVVEDHSKISTGAGDFETKLYGTRLLARYKVISDDEIVGLERLYFYTTSEGELQGTPVATVKSKITMRREK